MRMAQKVFLFFALLLVAVNAYIYYPFAPNAYYQEGMNVSFVSGRTGFYQETEGFGSQGIYNGALGLAFEKTEKYAFVASADGKKLRKLNYRTSQVGLDICSTNLAYPLGLVVNKANNKLYVGDRHKIVRLSFDINAPVLNEKYVGYDLIGNAALGLRDGNRTTTRFKEPRFVVIDKNDKYLYVSDVLNYRLRRVDISADASLVYNKNTPGSDAPLASTPYTSVTYASFLPEAGVPSTVCNSDGCETNGIALSFDNKYIFAVATKLNGIWKIPIVASEGYPSPRSGWTWLAGARTLAGAPTGEGGQLVDGVATGAKFYSPAACTIDNKDNLYVMDYWESYTDIDAYTQMGHFNYAIRRYDSSKNFVSTIAGKYCVNTFEPGATGADVPSAPCLSDGNGTVAGITKNIKVTVSSYLAAGALGDKLLFTDYGDNIVRKVECGPYDTMGMLYGECFLPTRGPTRGPMFAPSPKPSLQPVSAAPTDCASLFVKTPAGNGCPGYCDAPEFKATFRGARGADLSKGDRPDDYVIIADTDNNAIRKMVVSSGVVTTIAADFKWYRPQAVSIDANENVFITDLHRLVRIPADKLVEHTDAVNVITGSKVPGDADDMCPEAAPKGKPKARALSASGSAAAGSKAGSVAAGSKGTGSGAGGSVGSAGASAGGPGSDAAGSNGAGVSNGGSASDVPPASVDSSAVTSFDTSYSSASANSLTNGCSFNTPSGLDVDDLHQFVYVVDSGNNAVKRVSINPDYSNSNFDIALTTIVIDPLLNTPHGVVVIPSQGVIYVTSFGSHCVFKFDVSGSSFPVAATVANIYAGSKSGVFGHVDGSLSASVFMNPTGIAADKDNNLYLNEWYVLPGEVDQGSAWASEYGVSTGETVGGSNSDASGKSKGAGGKSAVGGSIGGKSAVASVGKSVGGAGKTVAAGSAGKSAGGSAGKSGAGGSLKGSSESSSEGEESVPNGPYGTASNPSDVNWGHEPQYLHNIRKIATDTGDVSTIAGSHIPGIFEHSYGSSATDEVSTVGGASLSGDSNGTSSNNFGSSINGGSKGSAKSAGSLSVSSGSAKSAASGSYGSAGSAKSAASGSGSSAGSAKSSATSSGSDGSAKSSGSAASTVAAGTHVRALKEGKDGHEDGNSGSMFDGYYSYSSKQCPVCEYRGRALSEDGGEGDGGDGGLHDGGDIGGDGKGKGKGKGGESHVGGHENIGKHDVKASASHYTNGHLSGFTSPDVDEHSSFDDGFAVYARFFKPYAITLRPDASVFWIADAGNNRIRNISCAGKVPITFDPTAEPTKRPTFVPTAKPSVKPSADPTVKPTGSPVVAVAPKVPGAGKGNPVNTKAPTKGVKGASVDQVGFSVSNTAESLPSSKIAIISVFAFIGAAAGIIAIYYRNTIIDMVLGSSTPVSKAVETEEPATSVNA